MLLSVCTSSVHVHWNSNNDKQTNNSINYICPSFILYACNAKRDTNQWVRVKWSRSAKLSSIFWTFFVYLLKETYVGCNRNWAKLEISARTQHKSFWKKKYLIWCRIIESSDLWRKCGKGEKLLLKMVLLQLTHYINSECIQFLFVLLFDSFSPWIYDHLWSINCVRFRSDIICVFLEDTFGKQIYSAFNQWRKLI